ncbi:MAG: tetratricopeptide repeat protein [Gemmataceae bacterium]
MGRARISLQQGFAVVAVLALAVGAWSAPVSEDDDAALRRQVLELNLITGADALEVHVEQLVATPSKTRKLLQVAAKMARGDDQPLNYNAAYVLAKAAQELTEADHALTFYRLAADHALKLESSQKLAVAFGGLIDVCYEHKRYDETVKICREFLELKGDGAVGRLKPAVMERMIQALTRQGKTDQALQLVTSLVKVYDGNDGWLFMQLKGWVERESGKYDDAAKTYETVLERIGKDDRIKRAEQDFYTERVRYILSSVYIDMKQVHKAAEHLQFLLKMKPDDPTYHNDLGFIWADHDMNLPESEKLIRRAIELDRKERKIAPNAKLEEANDNAAYLDSLGWVLFKQKKYKEALPYLEQAVKVEEGQHIEIFDHLGDCLKALGDTKSALEAYKKGVESAGTSRREQDRKAAVEKKIKALESQ